MAEAARAKVSPVAWLAAPAGLFFVLFFLLPFGVMALFSALTGNPMQRPNVTFTARHYARILDDSLYVESLASTLKIGAVTTAAALLLGYPLAHWMARMRSRGGHALLLMAVIAPMLTGIVVRTFAWMTILPDKGVINATLMAAGVIAKPLPLMYNEFGTVIALVHIYVPFMVLTLAGVIGRIDERLEEAARSLGASRAPRLPRGDAAAEPAGHPRRLAARLRAGDQRLCDALLHGRAADVLTLPMLIYQQVGASFNLAFAGALGVVLLVVSLALVVAYNHDPRPPDGRAGSGMNAVARQAAVRCRARRLPRRSNGAILFFLLAPIAVVRCSRSTRRPTSQFPPVGVTPALVREVLRQPRVHGSAVAVARVAGAVRRPGDR